MQTLLRLRRAEMDAAQAELAERLDHASRCRAMSHEADAAIQREFDLASQLNADDAVVEALSAWLPQGRAVASRARAASERAEADAAQSRAILKLARIASEAVAKLCEQRETASRLADEAKMQSALDEATRHRAAAVPPEV